MRDYPPCRSSACQDRNPHPHSKDGCDIGCRCRAPSAILRTYQPTQGPRAPHAYPQTPRERQAVLERLTAERYPHTGRN